MTRPNPTDSSDGAAPDRSAAAADVRAAQQAAVAALGVRALTSGDIAGVLRDAATVVAEALGTEFVKVVELLPDGRTARLVAGVGWRDGVVGVATITVGRDSQAGFALLSQAPVVVDDLSTETRLGDPPLLREHGVVSGMSVILYGPGGAAYGVLGAHTARRRQFTSDDVNFLQGVANVLSAALHRQHVEDELRRARAEAEATALQMQEQALELEQQTEEAQALAEELEQTNVQLRDATAEAESARDASDFLAEASRLLAASLDHAATLRAVAEAAVPRLGDWCAVDLVREPAPGGPARAWPPDVERVALVHRDPERRALGTTLAARYPVDWGASTGMAAVLRDARPLFVPVLTDEMLAAGARDADHLALLRALEFSSVIVAPLVARGRTLGALTLCHTESGRHYDAADLALAEDLAARAGVAVENARLYRDAEAAREAAEGARRQAEAANAAKSAFLATMSHELRTPLNAILGYAQLLEMGVLGPATAAQHAHLERLQASARHLLGLVDDVLDVAKADADRLEVRRDPLVTGTVVAAAVTLVQPQATAKGVRLMDLGGGGPGVPYVGDEHRVRQVLVNLLANAVKFTPPGGEVTVVCGAADEPDPGTWRSHPGPEPSADGAGWRQASQRGWAFVRVEDTGPGLAPELLGRVFEPFVQGDPTLTREKGGTGLGLAISRRLARLMRGDLTVRSRPGAGATFTLWLPGLPATDASSAAAESGRPASPLGVGAVAEPGGTPLDAGAFAVVHALGVRLATDAETVAERYVAALRADGRFPGARTLPAVQLRDYATPQVGLLASQLMAIGETRGSAAELLADGAQVQRVMAELHGAQRHRLGWAASDVERETSLLFAEVERALRDAVDVSAAAGSPEAVDAASVGAVSSAAVRAAAAYAVDVMRHVLEQTMRTSLRAYHFAGAAERP